MSDVDAEVAAKLLKIILSVGNKMDLRTVSILLGTNTRPEKGQACGRAHHKWALTMDIIIPVGLENMHRLSRKSRDALLVTIFQKEEKMVSEAFTNRKVSDARDAKLFQFLAGANTTVHQNMGSVDSTSSENDFFISTYKLGRNCVSLQRFWVMVTSLDKNSCGGVTLNDNFLDMSMGHYREIRAVDSATTKQECSSHVNTFAVKSCQLRHACAFLFRAIVIMRGTNATLVACCNEAFIRFPRDHLIHWITNVCNRHEAIPVVVRLEVVRRVHLVTGHEAFGLEEIRKHILKTPTFASVFILPLVVVAWISSDIKHCID
mmetsp:Transcript_3003/g.5116  ORF Transcript_3003/g.5116 Transcript_3003/m.5116 type:complete len:319 (-) Transcript_3003:508-1464(-)